jgi:L-alanine-DL-glutamate epimerase-like enolase superfamily enzyme
MVGGGLEAAVQAHLLAASPWAGRLEHENIGPLVIHDLTDTVGVNVDYDIAKTLPRYEKGFMYPPTQPGIGIEANETVIRDFVTPGKRAVVVE